MRSSRRFASRCGAGWRSVPRTPSTCSCSSRPSARDCATLAIEAADLYDRAIAAARANELPQHRGARRRARGAVLARRREAGLRAHLSRQGARRVRSVGRRRQGRRSQSQARPRCRGQRDGVRDVGLHDARPVAGPLRRARSRDAAQGEPGDRRRDRARAAARRSSWTSSARTPARSPSSSFSNRTASSSCKA